LAGVAEVKLTLLELPDWETRGGSHLTGPFNGGSFYDGTEIVERTIPLVGKATTIGFPVVVLVA
jgi:hypothetical protein